MSNRDTRPRALGVIPARGGSKRLPRKNILPVAGQPLIAYTIEAARQSSALTDFIFSTEDDEIFDVARQLGAPAPFKRPSGLSGDEVRNIDVVLHALDYMEKQSGSPYDIVVLLQPTCPIRSAEHIDAAVNDLWASDLQTLASVKGPFKKRDPVLKAVRDGILEGYCADEPEQDWEAFYIYNASIYAVKRDYLLEHRKLISTRQVPLIMDELHSVDIDTEADLLIAEACINFLHNR
jgi:CMP-N,N'-diacetyllegionaminic acid synthase